MINSVRMVNFKNFADETLKLGPFTVIVGANASGKSNIRDAFRFLHGIGRGYTLAEILGGKYGPGGQMEWEPIRGAPNEIARFGQSDSEGCSAFSIGAEMNSAGEKASYSIDVGFSSNTGFVLMNEYLKPEKNGEQGIENPGQRPEPLGRVARLFEFEAILHYLAPLGKMRFLQFSPDRIREPSFPGATMLGDYGQNLPSVLETICADSTRERNLMSWLQELSPMDVKEFDFPRDPSGRIHLHIVERNGRKVSAYSASDGALRFLGILTALFDPNADGLYFFEEIDKGIYPHRLWLLEDFIKRQTDNGKVQVITTTHSPALLSWLRDGAFENTSIVYRDEYWADSVIRPIADLYNLRELRKSATLGELFTEGWLEAAMKFSEGDPDSDHLDDDEDDWEQGTLE